MMITQFRVNRLRNLLDELYDGDSTDYRPALAELVADLRHFCADQGVDYAALTAAKAEPVSEGLTGAVLVSRELLERVADRLSKAQIFPLAAELRAAAARI